MRSDGQMPKHFVSELRITIKDQVLMPVFCRKRFSQLLRNPQTSGMLGDVEVQNAPTIMSDHEEAMSALNVSVGTVKKSIAAITSR
jgi:hypothetical protein